MFERFIRLMLAPDDGGGAGGTGGATAETTDTSSGVSPSPDAGAAASPSAAPAPVQPQQPQGPNWGALGEYDQVKADREYMNQLRQRYADPAWQQKYDGLFKEQEKPAAHPYDWMLDEKRLESLRAQGDQHPEFARYQAEFQNFFQNPIGQLGQYLSHPKVVEALMPAIMPQLQDLMQRQIQQGVGPLQQFVQQQGQQQFRAQYEKPWMALPDNIKQAAQQNRFGDWQNDRNRCIVNAVEFGKALAAQQQPTVEGAPTKPGEKPKPGAPQKQPTNSSSSRTSKAAEEFDREYTKAMGR